MSRDRAKAGANLPVLAPGERILLQSEAAPCCAVLGTDRAVHLASAHGWRAVPWPDVDVAVWDPTACHTVLRLWRYGARSSIIRIPSNRRLASLASERVAATQVLRRRVRLSQDAVALVVALRRPGEDSVHWRVQVDGADDGDASVMQEAADRVLAEIRGLAGC